MTDSAECHAILEAVRGFLSTAEMVGRDVPADEELLATGALDSLKIMALVAFTEGRCGCKIGFEEVLPENFGSAASVAAFIESKKEV